MRLDWKGAILPRGQELVEAATYGVTLRHLFYLLLEDPVLAETCPAFREKVRQRKPGKNETYGLQVYRWLSQESAKWRREGRFPDLLDQKNRIVRPLQFDDPDHAQRWLRENYRVDRTTGQPVSLYLAIEKATYVPLMQQWFSDLGVPILPLGGYTSQSFVKRIVGDVRRQPDPDDPEYARPAVLVVASDFDPSGLDIERDLVARTDCWAKVVRVALKYEQLEEFGLPESIGKESDPRDGEMVARYGRNIQVELEALPGETLRDLYQAAIDDWWDGDAYQRVLAREAEDLRQLEDHWDADGYGAARNTDQEER